MAIPPSPSPFQAQIGDDLTPQELHEYLHSILVHVLAPGSMVKTDARLELVTLLRDLCCIMMGEFPQADTSEWDTLKDRAKIIEVALEIIDRALRLDGVVGTTQQLERDILSQFLNFGGTLETWIVFDSHEGDQGISAQELKRRLRSVAMTVMTTLAGIGDKPYGEKRRPCWEALRACLEECLGIAAGTTFLTPFGIV